jgi:dipeptidyl aminopeptidase/acylaminoacyl peptidase
VSRPSGHMLSALALLLAGAVSSGCETNPRSDLRGTHPLELEQIFSSNYGIRSAAIHPGGNDWLAVADLPGGSGIYLIRRGSGGGPSSVTFWGEGSSPTWSPDGSRVAFLRQGELLLANADGSSAQALVQDHSGLRSPAFSPDGSRLAFYSSRSGHQDIWIVAAGGGDARQLTRGAMTEDDGRFAPAWAPDGRTIAYVSNEADWWHDDVWLVNVDDGARRRLSTSFMSSSTPAWSPDGASLAVMGTAKSGYWYQDLSDLYVLEIATGSEGRVDMQIWATDRIMSNPVLWSSDGTTLFFPYHERGNVDLWSVSRNGGIATRVTQLGGSIPSFDHAASAGMVSFVRAAPTEGRELWSIPTHGGRPERITDVATRFAGVQEPQEIYYRSWDGLFIQGFLYLPPGFDPNTPFPALIQVHGGGSNSYMRGENLVEQYLASRGYVVLAINYRGGSGFGRAFQDLAVEDWLNGQALDAASAADWIRTQPWSNGKVGIYGYSYGGSMAMAAITLAPDRFDAAVAMAGAYGKAELDDEEDRLGRIFSVTGHGGTVEERPEVYARSNTLLRVSAIESPVLLMHGEADTRVPFQHFELAVAALEAAGKEFETRTFPGEPHGFRNPANRVALYTTLEEFLNRHLKDGGT